MHSRWVTGLALAATLTASSLSTGCFKATFIDPNATAGVEHEEWTDFYLFGLVGTEEYDVRQFCQGPVAMVRTGANFGTGVISVLTLFIYMPRKVYVTCAAGPAAAPQASDLTVELDDQGKPVRVLGKVGQNEMSGSVVPVPGAPGAYRVQLRKGGAQ